MATLQGRAIKDTYKDLLQVSNGNAGVDGTLRTVEDGEGTTSALQISTSGVKINGTLDVTGTVDGVPHVDYRGVYASGTSYVKDDVVVYNGSSYIAKGNTTGNAPTNTTHWGLLASKGDNGVGTSTASINSSGNLILTLSDGSTIDCGTAKGADGIGVDGVSVTNATINSSGNLILTLSNGSTIDCGQAQGSSGTTIDSAIAKFLSTGVVINEDSADIDFRVEGNSDQNLIRTDAGNDLIAIGKTPDTTNTWGGSNNYKFKAQVRDSLCIDSTSGTAKLQLYSSATSSASANLQFYTPQHVSNQVGDYAMFIGGSNGFLNIKNQSFNSSIIFTDTEVYPFSPSLISYVIHNPMDLGTAAYKWGSVYCQDDTFNDSDRNLKEDISELNEAEKRVAVKCKGLVRKYRWKSRVSMKGENARYHIGIIAQELQEAFESEGLNAFDYGMIGRDTWYNGTNSEGEFESVKEPKEGYTEVTQYQVRYSEILAFIISAI